jgi:hypothetical protein
MEFRVFLLILVVTPLVFVVGVSHSNVFGWHEELGLSDQQAAQLYQTNPNDPQIIGWKNGLQGMINDYKKVCGVDGYIDPNSNICISSAKEINDLCVHHSGQQLSCLDPRIAQAAAGKANSTTSSNSSSATENTTEITGFESLVEP